MNEHVCVFTDDNQCYSSDAQSNKDNNKKKKKKGKLHTHTYTFKKLREKDARAL